jgi:hypothetical protein
VEELIGELQELFVRHNAGAALTAKAVFNYVQLLVTGSATIPLIP